SNASDYLIMLAGGKYQFTHCTMANYMNHNFIRNNPIRLTECLTLADHITYIKDQKEEIREFPLQQAFFDNCIIDGGYLSLTDITRNYTWEIKFLTDPVYQDGDDLRFNYRFNHCFIKTKKVENTRFHEVLFYLDAGQMRYIKGYGEYDDVFYDYIYDFRLANKSAGIGKADRTIAEKYPVDRYGTDRLTSENGPSIGAYEYVPQNEK
ncbi:MAG: hypothetical protein LBF05_06045, partial [Tannerella sp.]|nr:hypothetical protein [Tannerella sp.]